MKLIHTGLLMAALSLGTYSVYAAQSTSGTGDTRFDEEIIVSATYRDTDLMDTSISISALTNEDLIEQGIYNVTNLYNVIPGMSYGSNAGGFNSITVRGLTPPGPGSSVVAVYVDDVPVTGGSVSQIAGSLFDMERIEVLKGPQGTLYGEGAMGGAIRYLTKQPDPSGFDWGVLASVANNAESDDLSYRYGAMVNLPLIQDALALRLNAYRRDQAGFLDVTGRRQAEDVNTEEETALRAKLSWFATDNLEISLSANIVAYDFEGPALASFPFNVGGRDSTSFPNGGLDDQDIYNLTISYDLPWANFKSITSKFQRKFRAREEFEDFALFDAFIFFLQFPGTPLFDPTFTDPPPFLSAAGILSITDTERLIQEFRLVSSHDGPWSWSAGIYYKDEDGSTGMDGVPTFLVFPSRPELEPRIPQFHALFGIGSKLENKAEETAVYGNVNYQINDHWSVGLGLRFANAQRSVESVALEIDEDFIASRITIDYQPYDGLLTYFTVATGFRPGITNEALQTQITALEGLGAIPLAQAQAAFLASNLVTDGDEAINYELGLKADLLDGRMRLIASLYHIDWKNTLIRLSDTTLVAPVPFTYAANGDGATSQGIELNLDVAVTDNLTLSLGGDLNDSEIEGASAGQLATSTPVSDGNRLAKAPEYSFNIAADYRFKLGSLLANVRGDWTRVAESFNDVANEFRTSGYHRFNLRFGVRNQAETWRAVLFADNLFDETFAYELNPAGTKYGLPRAIGVEFTYNL